MKSQARSFQHNFVERWESQFSSLAVQDVIYEGFTRAGVVGWIVGYAETQNEWTPGRPCTVRMDELADGTAARLQQFADLRLSEQAWYGLDMLRGHPVYGFLFRPLDYSAVDVLTSTWGREGLQVGSLMLDWGYCLLLAQRELEATGPSTS